MTVMTAERVQAQRVSERFGSWTTRLFVFLLFSALSVGMTYPLILNLRKAVPGPPWDNMVWLYDLWWFRHSIVDLGQWPVINPTIFYPFGYDLRLSETMLANKALIAPLLFWGDEILAYNGLLLISFVLTGYTTYLLISYLTDNVYAAVVGAAIFAFSPYRMHAMAAGWVPLLATQWIPLIFLYLERTLREGKARYALFAGFFFALTLLSSWYYLWIVGLALLIYFLLRLRSLKGVGDRARLVRNLLFAGAVAAVMVLPVALPVMLQHSGSTSWSITDVEKWAASVEDFVLPNVYHPLWGEYFLSLRAYTLRYPWYAPGFVYLGLVALLLAAGSISRDDRIAGLTRPFFWIGLVSMLLALGLVLHANNEVVGIPVPAVVEKLFIRGMSALMGKYALHKASLYEFEFPQGTIPLPLPALFLYLFVPLASALRTLYRFGMITMLAVAVLAGVGAARMLGGIRPPDARASQGRYDMTAGQMPKEKSWPNIIFATVILLALVLVDFCSAPLPYGFTDIKTQPIDRWLAAHPDQDMVVMQFPLIRALSGDTLYRTKYHGKKVAYGHGTFYPAAFLDAEPILATFPSEECLKLLKTWGVTHIVVGSQTYDTRWKDVKEQTWEQVQAALDASPHVKQIGPVFDEPFWRDERVSNIIQGSPPVEPILVDKLYVYELQ